MFWEVNVACILLTTSIIDSSWAVIKMMSCYVGHRTMRVECLVPFFTTFPGLGSGPWHLAHMCIILGISVDE